MRRMRGAKDLCIADAAREMHRSFGRGSFVNEGVASSG